MSFHRPHGNCKTKCRYQAFQQSHASRHRPRVSLVHFKHREAYRLQKPLPYPSVRPPPFPLHSDQSSNSTYMRSGPDFAQAKLLRKTFPDIQKLSWYRSAPFFNLRSASCSLISLLPSDPSPSSFFNKSYPRAPTTKWTFFITTQVSPSTTPSSVLLPPPLLRQWKPQLLPWLYWTSRLSSSPTSILQKTAAKAHARSVTQTFRDSSSRPPPPSS